MLKAEITQTVEHTYLVDVDLDKSQCSFNKISNLVRNICLLTGAVFIELAQYIDHGFGCICFQNERIKVVWEEFPHNLSFELNSISNAELL